MSTSTLVVGDNEYDYYEYSTKSQVLAQVQQSKHSVQVIYFIC